jgi:hypothetical protein
MMRALVVLNHGAITRGYREDDKPGFGPAMFFYEDLYQDIFPVLWRSPTREGALFAFLQDLSKTLDRSVLGAEDLAMYYGYNLNEGPSPSIAKANWHLPPDEEHVRYATDPDSRDTRSWSRMWP